MANDDGKLVNQFTGIPIKHLIGAPLKAASEANGILARSQLQFILSSCFDKDKDSTSLKPKMIDMTLERDVLNPDGTMNNEKVSMTISVPLLTLIPINSLSVDDIQVAFEMEIQSANEEQFQAKDSKEKKREKKNGREKKEDIEMYGTLASKPTLSESGKTIKHSSNAHYEVQMHAGNFPLPTGLTTVIDLLNKSIAPIPTKNKTIEGI